MTWLVLLQGQGETHLQHLRRNRWDVWAGEILQLKESVRVAGKAWKGGESQSRTSNILERLENGWIETKKKLDHLEEGLHKAASQKHKGACGRKYQRHPQTPELCNKAVVFLKKDRRDLQTSQSKTATQTALWLPNLRSRWTYSGSSCFYLQFPNAECAQTSHVLCSLAPTFCPSSAYSRGLWQQNHSSFPLGGLINSRAREACALPYSLWKQRESLCTKQRGRQQGGLKGSGFHCAWESGQEACYRCGS